MAALGDLRVEESLRVKIGEAKNLASHGVSNSGRNTFCAVRLDSEEIFRTTTIEKTLNPFYGEEFQGEIPKKFRFLSFYVHESSGKTEKVLGKVTLKKEELYKYHNKEHWFPLTPQDVDAEVQGKVHIEVRFDEYLNTDPESFTSHRMAVRVSECSDLSVVNGSCNPYAVVTLSHDKSKHKDVKRTNVRKKTICPQFEETFFFDLENKGQNHDRTLYAFEDAFGGELSVSLWHDDSRVSREVLGYMFRGAFLGEVRIPLRGFDINAAHSAWYCLRGREPSKNHHQEMGSLRLKISYETDHIFLSHYYDDLRMFILKSPEVQPITSSAAYILGHIVDNRHECAQPLMKLFLHHDQLVPLVKCLADWEMSRTTDSNTFFRGNTLVTKMIDELMKLVGMPYLHDTLKPSINKVCLEHLPCEIDSTRLKEGENINDNLTNLKTYVVDMVTAITTSGLVCPVIMREVFHALKEVATKHFPENAMIKYRVISSFVFLRFFAPAILGPKLFEIHSEPQATSIGRTLTLISKAVQGLVNVVSSKSVPFNVKEEYMIPLFDGLNETKFVDAIKMFLDIVSSPTGSHTQCFEAPIILKEGMLIKRAQGRKRFGLKNFKTRYFCLTNQYLSYSKSISEKPLCSIPIEDILAVEKLEEESFKMKYMFQVIQPQHALYIQATNCVEEKQWLDILTKVCNTNKNRLKMYHPAAYMNNHWLCCKSADSAAPGCSPVSGGLPMTEIQIDIDSDREVEKIHSLFLTNMDKLDALQEACACQEVYSGDSVLQNQVLIDDTKSCYETLVQIQKHVISLEQEHNQYLRMLQKHTVVGSIDAPIGDESCGLAINPGTRL